MCSQRPKIHKSSLLESSRQHTQSRPLPCDPFSSFVFEKNSSYTHDVWGRACPRAPHWNQRTICTVTSLLAPRWFRNLSSSLVAVPLSGESSWGIFFTLSPSLHYQIPVLRGSKFLSCQSPSSQLLQRHRHLSSCDATWTIKNAFPPNHEVRMRSHCLPSYTISVASDQSVGRQSQDIMSRYTCCPLLSLR